MCCSVKRFLLLFGFLCLVSRSVADAQEENHLTCGRRKVKSIYLIHNGVDARAGHWPWHAAIFYRNKEHNEYECGGSILDHNTILTASHCVYTAGGVISATRVLVHVGQNHLEKASEYTQIHNVRDIIVHPGFSSNSIIHDIALIKLRTNITMTKYVQPVCLWTMDSKQDLIVGKNGTIVGFGLNEQDVVSQQLKQALVGVVDALTCIASDRTVFGTHLTTDMFCGKGQKGVSACNGDSGGGMFFEIGGKWYVRGLVSFTPLRGNTGLCDPLKYTAYTDVAMYLEWIKPHIDQRVLSYDSDVLDIDYEEKLRLFNFKTCGVKQFIVYPDGVSRWTIPWLGFVRVGIEDEPRCAVILINEWYAVGPAHCFENDAIEYFVALGHLIDDGEEQCTYFDESSVCPYPLQERPIERIIVHPKFGTNNTADNIALIELQVSADTSQPHVQPICVPVTPELRTNAKANLHVATVSREDDSYKNIPIHYLESVECMKKYAGQNIVLELENKRLCAEIANQRDEENCSPLVAGAPLQEMKMFDGKEQYFLRGFELLGLACNARAPPIYNNVEQYIDWILYNMRYRSLESVDGLTLSNANSTQQTLESEWAMLQQQPGKEKLHLFDMQTCGIPGATFENLGPLTVTPWVGQLESTENVTDEDFLDSDTVVLISEWYALAPKSILASNSTWRILSLGSYNRDIITDCSLNVCGQQKVEIKNIIIPSADHPSQIFALIELLEPANLKNPSIRPICLPFMHQLHRQTPTEVFITSTTDPNYVDSKKLKIIDHLNCQQRLLLEREFVTLDGNITCAIEAEKIRQTELFSFVGTPFHTSVWYDKRMRYFLYGVDDNDLNMFKKLIYGPYVFNRIMLADLDWVVENMREKERQTSFPSPTRKERVNLKSVKQAPKRELFNFTICGESSNFYPMPWMGVLHSNAPFFNDTKCTVTLISDRYVVGPAYCFSDVTAENVIKFGLDTDQTECARANNSALCGLPSQRVTTQKIIFHPHYNRTNHDNNIALAQLATAVDTSRPNVRPICLPIIDSIRSYDTSSLVMASYNRSSAFADSKIITVYKRYLEPLECQKRWQGLKVSFTIDNTQHCVMIKRTQHDECVAVFAGITLHSLQTLHSSEKHFLRGFFINGPRVCSIYFPAVYLNTDAYLDWILETMEQSANFVSDVQKELNFK
uniref:Peptidase S1 domain-containing protein n=1 Tax=Anopheles coluzzii TaxID=1518534 RepID=A0A8W7PWK0_ANOCL